MIKACVIGHPVRHSRSPLIHGYWLKRYGIAGAYEKQEIAPHALAHFMEHLPTSSFAGCNVTLPHKEEVARLVRHADEKVRRIGSANTLYIRDGEIYATSTDGYGFVSNLKASLPDLQFKGLTALVLGAGGSSRAIVDQLIVEGADRILIANRSMGRAEDLAQVFGKKAHAVALSDLAIRAPEADLIVNATSAGIADSAELAFPFEKAKDHAIASDINYVPLQTPFLRAAGARGMKCVGGLGMLLHQAVPGFELWFGKRPEVTEELYDQIARDVDPDYRP
jgi:shikimate dehydrogenase